MYEVVLLVDADEEYVEHTLQGEEYRTFRSDSLLTAEVRTAGKTISVTIPTDRLISLEVKDT